jgi:hypothetical protein
MKVSTSNAGGETWTYRLHRVKDPAAAAGVFLMADVPGVGFVARVQPPPAGKGPDVPGPTEIDRAGRGETGPGGRETASATWSRDAKSGKFEADFDPEPTPSIEGLGGKVKVVFVLDSSGRISEWSVSPRPRPEDLAGSSAR